MPKKTLLIYLGILLILCASVIFGARALGQQGAYLAQFYMLTPAAAALITRLFFYEPGFSDANLRAGKLSDYLKYWGFSLGITALAYGMFTLLGSISWDFTGATFLDQIASQLSASGQDLTETLPTGFTPRMMLMVFFIGGLTIFNIFPGIITGFGEEFGHRGLMFPLLYRIKPWVGFLGGGLIWFAWHLPLALVVPQPVEASTAALLSNGLVLALGSLCTFIYLAYVYVDSRSVFVTSIAHITMNNAAASFSYFAIIENQLAANLGLTLTMVGVAAVLYLKNGFAAFREYFNTGSREEARKPERTR